MCGIIGALGKGDTVPVIIEGLKRLEYRGYDSAGLAILNRQNKIERRRSPGKIIQLEQMVAKYPLQGNLGIGHTRWATHGEPNEANAHPHSNDQVAVVHNGIIENFMILRERLTEKGYNFQSDTDTEVLVYLLTDELNQGHEPKIALQKTLSQLEGAFAIGVIFAHHPNLLACARHGSPLAIGYGKDGFFIGSDALALAPFTSDITYLEEGDWAFLTLKDCQIFDKKGVPVHRPIQKSNLSNILIGKGSYKHFMLKETFEQPTVIGDILKAYLSSTLDAVTFSLPLDFKNCPTLYIIGCGTAHYAGLVARYWIESYAHIPVYVDIASEFRYRMPPLDKNSIAIFISQSGETADTLACLNYVKSKGVRTIGLVNVPESTMARQVDHLIETHAGPEIGVASTKAFTAQLTTLACLTLFIAQKNKTLSPQKLHQFIQNLTHLPRYISEILEKSEEIQKISACLKEASSVLYLGRNIHYPIALEGALKLKELSYIHAEAFATGELKHGPIALVDEKVPIIFLAPQDDLSVKNISNLEEVLSRQGKVIYIGAKKLGKSLHQKVFQFLELSNEIDVFTAPIAYTIPLQLISYYTAVLRGTDVDQPRNLAKSVTVE